ncbi:MAG: hypothetical protein C0497_04040 [Gemmatimonas sp.]|nr:hypothetical protein [Gemmatimonas sp.]
MPAAPVAAPGGAIVTGTDGGIVIDRATGTPCAYLPTSTGRSYLRAGILRFDVDGYRQAYGHVAALVDFETVAYWAVTASGLAYVPARNSCFALGAEAVTR